MCHYLNLDVKCDSHQNRIEKGHVWIQTMWQRYHSPVWCTVYTRNRIPQGLLVMSSTREVRHSSNSSSSEENALERNVSSVLQENTLPGFVCVCSEGRSNYWTPTKESRAEVGILSLFLYSNISIHPLLFCCHIKWKKIVDKKTWPLNTSHMYFSSHHRKENVADRHIHSWPSASFQYAL